MELVQDDIPNPVQWIVVVVVVVVSIARRAAQPWGCERIDAVAVAATAIPAADDLLIGHRRVNFVQHVSVDFSGHHEHIGIAIDARVAREKPDTFAPKLPLKVAKLLIAQRLQRCGVDDALLIGKRKVDAEFSAHRLSRACRRRYDHRVRVVQRTQRVKLKVVERERERLGQQGERRPSTADLPLQLANDRGGACKSGYIRMQTWPRRRCRQADDGAKQQPGERHMFVGMSHDGGAVRPMTARSSSPASDICLSGCGDEAKHCGRCDSCDFYIAPAARWGWGGPGASRIE